MSQSFEAAVRARAALTAARHDGDADQVLQAEADWEDVQHFARRHGVPIDSAAEAPGEPDRGQAS